MHPDKRAAIKCAILVLVIVSIIAYSLYRKEYKGGRNDENMASCCNII